MNTVPNPDKELETRALADELESMWMACRNYKDEWMQMAKLLKSREERLVREAHIYELEMAIAIRGKVLVHGVILNAKDTEGDPDSIDINMLKARLAALKEEK